MARELVGWGPTEAVLTEKNLYRARALSDNWADANRHHHHHDGTI
jgi:hypothetical protein